MLLEPLNFRDIGVRQTFVVGVDFLREVLQNLSSGKERWWIEKESATSVIFGHDRPEDEETPQLSPTLISIAKVDEDTICLFTSQKIVKPGIYRYKRRKIRDEALDLDRSWEPLKRALLKQDRRERLQRAQERLHQRLKSGSLPTWEDCLLRDNETRRRKIDAKMLQRLMTSDEIDYSPDRVLANEEKRIADVREFTIHFQELLQKGCKAGTLAQTLGYFESYLTARNEHQRDEHRFPSRPKVRKLASTLRDSAVEIEDLQFWYDPVSAVLNEDKVSEMEKARDEIHIDPIPPWWRQTDVLESLSAHMTMYASILEHWQPPRSDSIRGYGVIAACVYAEIATGQPNYALVCDLLSDYSGERSDEVFTENPLSKRVRYFQENFPEAYKLLRLHLTEQHHSYAEIYPEPNCESLLSALEKSN